MSTSINYSKTILLGFAFCLSLLVTCGSIATAQEIQWLNNLDQAKAEAAKTNRLVWLHFEADWCAPCKKLETFVFRDPSVVRTSDRNVVAVKIDADENDLLVRKLGVPRIPYDIVMTPEGETIVNRLSPRITADYLKMFNSLDAPLQALNGGDREIINSDIRQVHKVVEKVGGFRQNKSALDLEGPSHQMAATTIEGQRLERGLSSVDRAAELRAIEAKLLKQKAKLFIAQEELRLKGNQGPKLSDNPFFKGPNTSALSVDSQAESEVVLNQFVAKQNNAVQAKPAATKSSLLPAAPSLFSDKRGEQVDRNAAKDLSLYGESQEFSFPGLAAASKTPVKKAVEPTSTLPTLTLPKFTPPKLPEFKDRSGVQANSDGFAYAPIGELKKALRTTADPKVDKAKENPLRSTLAKQPATPTVKPPSTPPADIAAPQPPVMVEGVVKIAAPTIVEVEGRLVAAEQPVENDVRIRRQRPSAESQQVAQTDRRLNQVDFFGVEKPAEPPTQVTVVQAQPAPQPQVVINLNTGAVAQPVTRNHGRIVQQSAVAQATATTTSGNRARIVSADIASAVQSKYALKGKCPVTLLTRGQWVDGKKEIGCIHRDRVYLFASAENREAFLANPDQMSPLLAGFDPVIFEETGKLVEGEEQFGTFMGDAPSQRIVLFKTANTRDRFQKEPIKYINAVRNAMAKKAKKDIKLR